MDEPAQWRKNVVISRKRGHRPPAANSALSAGKPRSRRDFCPSSGLYVGQTGLISPLQSDESVRYGSRNVARTLACEYDCTPTGSIALLTNVIDLHPGVAKSVSRSASFHCDGRWD